MLLRSSRPLQAVSRALSITHIPFSPRFKSSSASTASKSLAPLPKSPHPIFQSYRSPTLLIESISDARCFSSSNDSVISDDDFQRLSPLEQHKHALSTPLPTTFPRLHGSTLDAAMKLATKKNVDITKASDFPLGLAVKQLAFHGDRIWEEVVVATLFVIKSQYEEVEKGVTAGRLATSKTALVTNVIAAKLSEQLGLREHYQVPSATGELCADLWEAYLSALYWEQGRRALMEFLVPIIKVEYERHIGSGVQSKSGIIHVEAGKPRKVGPTKATSMKSNDILLPADLVDRSAETLRISQLPKSPKLSFTSLTEARQSFLSKLDEHQIPYTLWISPTTSKGTLQLPGVPLIQVRSGRKMKDKKEGVKAKMVTRAKDLGYFVILDPEPTIGSKRSMTQSSATTPTSATVKVESSALIDKPLVFSDLATASTRLLPTLTARKVRFKYKKPRAGTGPRTLTVAGFPSIISKAKSKAEHRKTLLAGVLRLGIVKIEAPASTI